MVEVCLMSFVERHVSQVAIVGILLDQNDVCAPDRVNDRTGDRCLPRTCSSTYSYEHNAWSVPQKEINHTQIHTDEEMTQIVFCLSLTVCICESNDLANDSPQ